jgi:hypothetical protein
MRLWLSLFFSSILEIFGENYSFPHSLYSLYHEYHPDLDILLRHTIYPPQVYFEIQSEGELFLSHLPSVLEYLQHGAVILIVESQCERSVQELHHHHFYCMNSYDLLSDYTEDGQAMNIIQTYFPTVVPAFVKFSMSNGLLLRHSELLKQQASLFYVRNEYQFSSKSLIEMFSSAGICSPPHTHSRFVSPVP